MSKPTFREFGGKHVAFFVLLLLTSLAGIAFAQDKSGRTVDLEAVLSDAKIKFDVQTAAGGKRIFVLDAPVVLRGLQDVTIQGDGAELLFTDPKPGKGGVRAIGWRRVKFIGVTIGWRGDPGYSRDNAVGTQVGTSQPDLRLRSFGKIAACEVGQGGAITLEDNTTGQLQVGAVNLWNLDHGWPWNRPAIRPDITFPRNTVVTFKGGKSECLKQLGGAIGETVIVRHYLGGGHAFQCRDCQAVTVENVTIHSAPGMAFVFEQGGQDLSLIGNRIAPRCKPACKADISTTGDGAHFAGVGGKILIEGNDFGWQGDDSVNVTGLLVEAALQGCRRAARQQVCSFRPSQRTADRANGFKTDTPIAVFDTGLNALADGRFQRSEQGILELTLPNDVPGLVGANTLVLSDKNAQPTNVTIRANYFHDHRARGMLIGSSNTVVEDNTIERVSMNAILIGADTENWFEGPGAKNVVIRRNRIRDVNAIPTPGYPGAISAGVRTAANASPGKPISDIRIEGNQLSGVRTEASRPVFIGPGVDRATVNDNSAK